MWPFKKKQLVPPPCNHKYKDFPWYIEATYYTDTHRLDICIKEPYVCIKCKNRKDVVLYQVQRYATEKEAVQIVENFKEIYKDKIKPEPIVNDMIADMQLVDREYLDTLESILNPKDSFEKT